jgi:sugar lactone lactonase YvrE
MVPNTNFAILKMAPGGSVTEVAAGKWDNPYGSYPYVYPLWLAVDSAGNVYFSDGESTIRRVSKSGVVTVFAGALGSRGYVDGPSAAARFNAPGEIALDRAGNIYVADLYNSAVRKISPDGTVSTAFGWGNLEGVAVDPGGNMYVSDTKDAIILKVAPDGVATTHAGTKGAHGIADGTGAAAQFAAPGALAVDAECNVYVADGIYSYVDAETGTTLYVGNTIRKITPGGMVTTLAGNPYGQGGADGQGSAALFGSFQGLAVNGNGTIYVADNVSVAIRSITPSGFVTSVMGANHDVPSSSDGIGTAARFNAPGAVSVDAADNVYVADAGNGTIRKITPAGDVTTVAGTAGVVGTADGTGASAQFKGPSGVAVDAKGNIYVADTDNHTIREISPSGAVTTLAGTAGAFGSADGSGAAARFSGPSGVAVDAGGTVYVADTGNNTIREISPGGVVTTLAGGPGTVGGFADGAGSSARFESPEGVAVDAKGDVYVADTGNNAIRVTSSAGIVTTLAGAPSSAGNADGPLATAQFGAPQGVAVDSAGNVYVADTRNSTIRRITPDGSVTTLAGTSYAVFSAYTSYVTGSPYYGGADGTGASAQFYRPAGIAADASGTLFMADSGTNTIRVGFVGRAPPVQAEPSFESQEVSQTIAVGATAVFAIASQSSPAPAFQWSFNGAPIPGADGPALVVPSVTIQDAGDYSCAATNPQGVSVTSAVLAVDDSDDPGRLINVSCRSYAGAGAETLIAGFVVGGTGASGSEALLLRASGPALSYFFITGLLLDPELQIVSSSSNSVIASNSGWVGNALVSSTAAAVGAFQWNDPASHDSALVESLAAGPYTALVSGAAGDSGIALAEVYDATPQGTYTASTPRLINISARTMVGQGSGVLIAGFVIGGTTPRTVLIRASGPALVPFGLSGVLPDPQLTLNSIVRNTTSLVATNAGWGGDAQIEAVAQSLGAFPWGSAPTADSALLVTLAPGAYTAEVSGASGDTGMALVEVYEVE